MANGTIDSFIFHKRVLVGMRQPNVPGETVSVRESFSTVGAGFGSLIVSFLMPYQFRFGRVDFSALAHVILFAGLFVEVYTVTMLNEVRVSKVTTFGYFEVITHVNINLNFTS